MRRRPGSAGPIIAAPAQRANEAGKAAASCVKLPAKVAGAHDPSDTSNVLPETAAAERLRQHLQEIARERDRAHRALQEREAELARIQRIGRVGGVEVDFRDGFKNRRSPEYLIIHGLPPDAANETHEDWVERIHPDDRERTVKQFFDALAGRERGLFRRIPHHPAERRRDAMDPTSSPRSSATARAARCGWSAPISTSPTRCWRRKRCAKARSASA